MFIITEGFIPTYYNPLKKECKRLLIDYEIRDSSLKTPKKPTLTGRFVVKKKMNDSTVNSSTFNDGHQSKMIFIFSITL